MSSFGLPALAIHAPEQDDLLSKVGKISQLRSLLHAQQMQPLQTQLEQQKVQGGQIALKEQQDAAKDRQIYGQAFLESQGNSKKALDLATSRGASPEFLAQAKQAAMKADVEAADLVQKQGANALQQADLMKGAHDAVDNADPRSKPIIYQQQLAGLQQAGLDTSRMPPQYPGDQAFKFIGAAVVGHKQLVEDHLKNQQAAEAAQLQQQHAIDTQQKQLTLAGTSPTGVTAEQQAQLGAQQRGQNIQMRGQNMTDARDREKIQQVKTDKGTWSIQEDATGKPLMFNNKTGEVQAAPAGIAKAGTYQKQLGGAEESVQYAKEYLAGQNFTGPGDEALMEKFFDVAKPSSGFRMTQPQMDMLNHARDAYQGLLAKGKHLLSPNAPYFDDTQRAHIVNTMNDIITAKKKVRGGDTGGAPVTATGPNGHKIMLKGNQWVDAQTGAPIQ